MVHLVARLGSLLLSPSQRHTIIDAINASNLVQQVWVCVVGANAGCQQPMHHDVGVSALDQCFVETHEVTMVNRRMGDVKCVYMGVARP